MSCPNCNSGHVEMTWKRDDGQGYYEEEEYLCEECGCEWNWKMEKTITKQGMQDEGD